MRTTTQFCYGDRVRIEGEAVALFGRMGTVRGHDETGVLVYLDSARTTGDYIPFSSIYTLKPECLTRKIVRYRPPVPGTELDEYGEPLIISA